MEKLTTELEAALQEAASAIKDPSDYFVGHRGGHALVPDDVLMFCRHHRRQLSPGVHAPHHRYVLVTVLSTAGTMVVDAKAYRLRPGDGFLIFPFQFHHYSQIDAASVNWLFTTFELAQDQPVRSLGNSPRRLSPEAISDLFQACRTYTRIGPDDETAINSLRLRIGCILTSMVASERTRQPRGAAPRSTGDTRLLEKVGRYVFSHLNESISVDCLARHVGISESHLRSLFRRRHGWGLYRYVRHIKMLQAMRIIRSGEMNVSEIAESLGYSSLFAFSRSFKLETGMSPRGYGRAMVIPVDIGRVRRRG
jgi:AraC-like DNA-binding protein